jgi:GAF domain
MPAIKPRDVNFLGLRDSILCSECELISYNNTAKCLACGSTAVLSLSRVLGGSLQGESRVRMVSNEPGKVVEFRGPAPVKPVPITAAVRSGAEVAGSTPVHSAMKLVVERGYSLSRSGGVAIAAHRRGGMVCEARQGTLAPPLGAEIRSGISALSLHSRRTLRCDVAGDDPRVDAASSRALGINSIVAAPIANLERVFGLITVLSPLPYAFDDRDVAIVQWLAGMMAVVFTGAAADLSFIARSTMPAKLPGSA